MILIYSSDEGKVAMHNHKILNNTIMLMIFNVAKIVFPFITLPYLTRVLTVEAYGTVAYAKTIMSYMQIFIDFGFVLSATKDIVKCANNKKNIGLVVGNTIIAKMILSVIGFIILTILILCMPILRENIIYTLLSYISVVETIFLMDFLFRGLEKMHIITIRFILMKTISTILTFVLIKNDRNMMLIPILDILSTSLAVGWIFIEMKKMKLVMYFKNIKKAYCSIKDSFIYFLSDISATSFNALSTVIIGIVIGVNEVAYWSVCMQVVGSIQAFYIPFVSGVYPEMIKTKNYNLIKKVIKIVLPIVLCGCIFSYFFAETGFMILGGEKYLKAVPIFRILIPSLFFGFLSVMYGWPTLGVIGKTKETTFTTLFSIVINIVLLGVLIITNSFTLINVAIIRTFTEIIFFCSRYYLCRKYKNLFNNID